MSLQRHYAGQLLDLLLRRAGYESGPQCLLAHSRQIGDWVCLRSLVSSRASLSRYVACGLERVMCRGVTEYESSRVQSSRCCVDELVWSFHVKCSQ